MTTVMRKGLALLTVAAAAYSAVPAAAVHESHHGPFSFANNEAKGRLRATVEFPDRGTCRSGLVTWEARR